MAILGVWMWVQNVERFGAEQTAEYCRRAGVTDLYFLTKGLAGTTAFHGAYAPHASRRDLLDELLHAAHRRGMRVHAWFTSACDEHYKQQYPQSGRCHLVRGRDRELISLADEGYLAYMEKIITEVCGRYEIDGLHLDYIRYNHLTYGWAQEDLARYAAQGADPQALLGMMRRMYVNEPKETNLLFDAFRAGDENARALARTRRMDVMRFAGTLTAAARAVKSGLILSAALMPEGAYEEIAFSELHYGQNYEDAAGLYDYALPMAYSRAYRQDSQWVKRVAEGTLKRGLKTIVGLHAFEGGTGPSLSADIKALENSPVEGLCLFREGAAAMAWTDDRTIAVYNAMEEKIIRVEAGGTAFEETIETGKESVFRLPKRAQTVRVFTGAGEACVYRTERV